MTTVLSTYIKPTLIEVMAPHCVECRAMQPDLDAVAAENLGNVDLVVVDAARESDVAADLRVMGTPTLIAVSDGVEVARFTGRRSRTELAELFAAVAAGETSSVPQVSKTDRLVWSVAGTLLAGTGLLIGSAWFLVVAGVALLGYANLPRSR